jgi:hypothetical protein
MPLEKNHQKSHRISSDGKLIRPQEAHIVFVTDDHGISSAFELLKLERTRGLENFLTLIYIISGNEPKPLFRAELENIERRFPSRLITYYIHSKHSTCPADTDIHQQILEVVINCNTCTIMQFQVTGQDELVGMVNDRLQFLGIKSNQICSQII